MGNSQVRGLYSTFSRRRNRRYPRHVRLNLAESHSLLSDIVSIEEFSEFEEYLKDRYSFFESSNSILYIEEAQLAPNLGDFVRLMKEKWKTHPCILSGSMIHRLFKNRFPVGRVQQLTVRPLSFEEFLAAKGRKNFYLYI